MIVSILNVEEKTCANCGNIWEDGNIRISMLNIDEMMIIVMILLIFIMMTIILM